MWTWEGWQWKGTLHSPNLQDYWSLTIRLFRVISRTLVVVGVLPADWANLIRNKIITIRSSFAFFLFLGWKYNFPIAKVNKNNLFLSRNWTFLTRVMYMIDDDVWEVICKIVYIIVTNLERLLTSKNFYSFFL